MKLEQSKIVEWKNEDGKKILWMITDKENIGVVIHSDDILKLGTTTDLKEHSVLPFVGSITINSHGESPSP